MKKKIAHIAITAAIAVVVTLALGFVALLGLREAARRAWIRLDEHDVRSVGVLGVGDLAPDLALEALDGSGPRKLSDFYREKPLVLVFGSYT